MMRSALAPLFLLCAACAHPAPAPAPAPIVAPRSANDIFLDGLIGDWEMTGAVMGDPVRYRADGARTLEGAWVEFHMIDAATPPQYEARVFIGADESAQDYVAHWLDGFGAGGARVAALGARTDNQLRLEFPYAQGKFRNLWERRDKDSWTLTIDAENAGGSWSEFAHYSIERR
ncbi:MAG: hypothetical protein A3E78_06235 [Alphaproteobacteria bacterium RIFCSPHIGHO2_12_FULL_63_12]|nr:MAG: hypothetical protein A3E78_06235 [Alphaproteobacteria bacterium RIFCSPHIGHO2_12_FULL_63_12]